MARTMKFYTTAMLCITVFFLYADQNLLAPNLTAIANDFGFTSEQRDRLLGGYIAIGFFIVGGPMALFIGYCADFYNRVFLFSFVVAFGESAGLATYWVQSYEQLFACRVLTGISFGGATPIIFSMLGDLYSGKHRIYVSTFVGISLSAGVAVGQLVSGLVGPTLGWRAPFLIIAIPALCCALAIALTVKEPKRGDQEHAARMLRSSTPSPHSPSTPTLVIAAIPQPESSLTSPDGPASILLRYAVTEIDDDDDKNVHYSETLNWNKVVRLFSTPSAAIIFIQGFPGCIPWGMICVFLNDFLSEDRGMTIQAATAVLTCYSLGGLLGQLAGGWIGQHLYNRDPRYQCGLMGMTTIVSVFPLLYLLNAAAVGDFGFYFMAVLGGFVVNMNGPNVRVVLQNVCIPEIRGSAFAIFTLSDDIGKGLGPALVVLLIGACGGSRTKAFNVVAWFWIFCGTLLSCLVFTVLDDEAVVQAHVKNALLERLEQNAEGVEAGHSPKARYQRVMGECNACGLAKE